MKIQILINIVSSCILGILLGYFSRGIFSEKSSGVELKLNLEQAQSGVVVRAFSFYTNSKGVAVKHGLYFEGTPDGAMTEWSLFDNDIKTDGSIISHIH